MVLRKQGFSKTGFCRKTDFQKYVNQKSEVLQKTGFCRKPGFVENRVFVENWDFPFTRVFFLKHEIFKPRDFPYIMNGGVRKFLII